MQIKLSSLTVPILKINKTIKTLINMSLSSFYFLFRERLFVQTSQRILQCWLALK